MMEGSSPPTCTRCKTRARTRKRIALLAAALVEHRLRHGLGDRVVRNRRLSWKDSAGDDQTENRNVSKRR